MDAQVGGADLTNAQLLLLVRAGRHRVPVLLLGDEFLLAKLLDLLHQLDTLVHLALSAGLFGFGQLFADGLAQPVDLFGLGRHFGRQFFLCFGQPLLGQLCSSIAVIDKSLEMLTGVNVIEVIFGLRRFFEVSPES